MAKNGALCLAFVKWLVARIDDVEERDHCLRRLRVLHMPFNKGVAKVRLNLAKGQIELSRSPWSGLRRALLRLKVGAAWSSRKWLDMLKDMAGVEAAKGDESGYSLAIVDEAHHIYGNAESKQQVEQTIGLSQSSGGCRLLLLSDVSQSRGTKLEYPVGTTDVELKEVRCPPN